MADANHKRRWTRWLLVVVLVAVALPIVLIVGVIGILSTGTADNYIRAQIVGQIGKRLNGSAELARFHFNPWGLRLVLNDFTIHGREPLGTPAFFHADRIEVGLRVDSVWG